MGQEMHIFLEARYGYSDTQVHGTGAEQDTWQTLGRVRLCWGPQGAKLCPGTPGLAGPCLGTGMDTASAQGWGRHS